MLKALIIFASFAFVTTSQNSDWVAYKARFGKSYSPTEDAFRQTIYASNVEKVRHQNKLYANRESSFHAGENKFTDWTDKEFEKLTTPMSIEVSPLLGFNVFYTAYAAEDVSDLPEKVDWREQGYVSSVKEQGDCNSCYAFVTAGVLEGQLYKKTSKLVNMSVSNVVDCSFNMGNLGCWGGWLEKAYNYVRQYGIVTDKVYPYTPELKLCRYLKSHVAATIGTFGVVKKFSETALQRAVATIGPIAASINVQPSFKIYTGGLYSEEKCSNTTVNHAVLVVGYGSRDGHDYWIVKNSWGTEWGEGGYVYMTRNKHNQCAIASLCTYPQEVNATQNY